MTREELAVVRLNSPTWQRTYSATLIELLNAQYTAESAKHWARYHADRQSGIVLTYAERLVYG